MRLIDADAVLDIIRDYFVGHTEKIAEEYGADDVPIGVINPYLVMNKELRTMVRQIPTVDAVPMRHGHWIGESQTKFRKLLFPSRVFKCSVCGNYLDFDGVNVGRGSANFCPNCGAKMDEVEDNEIHRR